MHRPKHGLTLSILLLSLTSLGLAQNKSKIKELKPTWKGSTGLFNVYVADSLRPGEFSVGVNSLKFHREPGDLDFTLFPVSVTIGLHDRLEIFGSWETYKRVNADAILEKKVAPGGPLLPARLKNSAGTVAWYNDAPLMDVGFGDHTGDIWAGLKFVVLSERLGDPFGLALQPIARFHTKNDREGKLRGVTVGVNDYGFDGIFSKGFANGATFAGNAGILWADDLKEIDRQNRFNWGIGADVPLGNRKVHAIGEFTGSTFFGDRAPGLGNPKSPADIYGGLRFYPIRWLSIAAAYNFNLQTIDSDAYGVDDTGRHGWFAQIEFGRKINEPPAIECTAERNTVTEGESVTVRAIATDPDDDELTITWKTSGGKITQQNGSATFDSTGLAPGRYTITAEVTDGEHTATCSVDVTVEKRKMAPTITCEPSVTSVTEGESVTLRARASDPNNDPLTYSWTVDGQAVTNDAPEFVFGTAGRTVGDHTVRVTVTDVDGMSASCDFRVTINRRPNRPPTVSLTLDKNEVFAGETVNATAQGSDPDGDPLTYAWTVDGQNRSETSTQLAINTSGMAGGSHSVTVTVNDGRGGTASDTESFTVREKIVIQYDRLDNVAKARLDEIALRMQQDSRLRAVITGHTDSRGTQRAKERAAARRANDAKDYLVKQHNIDEARIEVRNASDSQPVADNATAEGRRQNQRIEIELFVP
ncbi:MAG: PKD domain-containing protein [Acidobacteria bacterium]|nr:PKD domain-containing protein [Acidobacteriota bacterium]